MNMRIIVMLAGLSFSLCREGAAKEISVQAGMKYKTMPAGANGTYTLRAFSSAGSKQNQSVIPMGTPNKGGVSVTGQRSYSPAPALEGNKPIIGVKTLTSQSMENGTTSLGKSEGAASFFVDASVKTGKAYGLAAASAEDPWTATSDFSYDVDIESIALNTLGFGVGDLAGVSVWGASYTNTPDGEVPEHLLWLLTINVLEEVDNISDLDITFFSRRADTVGSAPGYLTFANGDSTTFSDSMITGLIKSKFVIDSFNKTASLINWNWVAELGLTDVNVLTSFSFGEGLAGDVGLGPEDEASVPEPSASLLLGLAVCCFVTYKTLQRRRKQDSS